MDLLASAALLVTAFLFGGMALYSFGFAAFLFSHLPPAEAGSLLRQAFPHFYSGVIVVAVLASGLLLRVDPMGSSLIAGVAFSTLPVRQQLMPAINAASDAGERTRFNRLHGLSVAIGLLQIVVVAYVLLRML
jgi:hypothetical protein